MIEKDDGFRRTMKQNHYFYYLIITLISIIFVSEAGCIQQRKQSPSKDTIASTQTVQRLSSTKAKTVITGTELPVPASSLTSPKTLVPTAAYTWTPINTLSPEQGKESILELFSNNGGCQIPCWWGITPGQTIWQTARNTLSSLVKESKPFTKDQYLIYDYSFQVPKEIAIHPEFLYFEPSLWIMNNRVMIITLNSGNIQPDYDYSLSGLLKKYGQPTEIWIMAVTDTQLEPHYEIDLFYPHTGLVLNATGTCQLRENILTICPQKFQRDIYPPAITVFSPTENYSFSTIHSLISRGEDLTEKYQLLSEVAIDFNEEIFFHEYIDPQNKKCIEIDITK